MMATGLKNFERRKRKYASSDEVHTDGVATDFGVYARRRLSGVKTKKEGERLIRFMMERFEGSTAVRREVRAGMHTFLDTLFPPASADVVQTGDFEDSSQKTSKAA